LQACIICDFFRQFTDLMLVSINDEEISSLGSHTCDMGEHPRTFGLTAKQLRDCMVEDEKFHEFP
jgi:hypothetical protein